MMRNRRIKTKFRFWYVMEFFSIIICIVVVALPSSDLEHTQTYTKKKQSNYEYITFISNNFTFCNKMMMLICGWCTHFHRPKGIHIEAAIFVVVVAYY